MTRVLDVYLFNKLAGTLTRQDTGVLHFQYTKGYLEEKNPYRLSISMPLSDQIYDDKIARPFFSGLLPDDVALENLAKYLGFSPKNSFGLLEAVGGECAGAISLYPSGNDPQKYKEEIKILSDQELNELLEKLKTRPLLAGEDGLRLSLAGAQDKLAVKLIDNQIALIKGTMPTSHILKPMISGVSDSIYNELFCLQLAEKMGLSVPKTSIMWTQEKPFFIIERYDRKKDDSGEIFRLHQEDFCQALSIPPEIKYQREGGPGLTQCLSLIDNYSKQPAKDRLAFIQLIIFNYLIGNADAHAKNFGFLYTDFKPELSPAYDLLSTAVYENLSKKMAMKIGSKYDPERVMLHHWYEISGDKAPAKAYIEKELKRFASITPDKAYQLKENLINNDLPSDIYQKIIAVIEKRANIILKYF